MVCFLSQGLKSETTRCLNKGLLFQFWNTKELIRFVSILFPLIFLLWNNFLFQCLFCLQLCFVCLSAYFFFIYIKQNIFNSVHWLNVFFPSPLHDYKSSWNKILMAVYHRHFEIFQNVLINDFGYGVMFNLNFLYTESKIDIFWTNIT